MFAFSHSYTDHKGEFDSSKRVYKCTDHKSVFDSSEGECSSVFFNSYADLFHFYADRKGMIDASESISFCLLPLLYR